MISQVNSAAVNSAYQNSNQELKNNLKKTQEMNKQADMSKTEKLKTAIESGEYKVNLESLSKRIADELM